MNFAVNKSHQQRMLAQKGCVRACSSCRRSPHSPASLTSHAVIKPYDLAIQKEPASAIGQRLGLLGKEEYWHGVGLLWAFTYPGPGPLRGLTFYVPAGSTLAYVASRWSEKQALSVLND